MEQITEQELAEIKGILADINPGDIDNYTKLHVAAVQMFAHIRTLTASQQWCGDMDKAPRDGTGFLAWGSYDRASDRKHAAIVRWSEAMERRVDGEGYQFHATHWRPIVPPGNTEVK